MDNPGHEHWKAMGRLIGYIGKERTVELRLMKPKDLKVYAYVDSNYATNTETRKSVTGYIITIGGCLINWTSKTQPSVTLSSTEAEYVAASMCAGEIKFLQMLMEELMPNERFRPATLFEDNTGAMFLMENQAVGNRTKHIDIRWHHMREMMTGDDPRLSVRFVPSAENFADLETKNVTEAVHKHLAERLTNGRIAEAIFAVDGREDVMNCSRVNYLSARDPRVTNDSVDYEGVGQDSEWRDPNQYSEEDPYIYAEDNLSDHSITDEDGVDNINGSADVGEGYVEHIVHDYENENDKEME